MSHRGIFKWGWVLQIKCHAINPTFPLRHASGVTPPAKSPSGLPPPQNPPVANPPFSLTPCGRSLSLGTDRLTPGLGIPRFNQKLLICSKKLFVIHHHFLVCPPHPHCTPASLRFRPCGIFEVCVRGRATHRNLGRCAHGKCVW